MPVARFWRVSGVSTYDADDLELSELALYEAGSRVDAGATLSSVLPPAVGDLASLSDGSVATTAGWSAQQVLSPGFALIWDFGAGVTKDVSSVGAAGPARGRFPALLSLSFSADGLAWTDIGQTSIIYSDPTSISDCAGFEAQYQAVQLMLHFDGENDSTSFVDSSLYQMIVTPNGGVKLSNVRSKFGATSALFYGSGDFLTLGGAPGLAFGSQDFTVEMWVWLQSLTGDCTLYDSRPSARNGAYPSLSITPTNVSYYTNGAEQIAAAHGISALQWFHVALCRVSGATRVFINGVQKGSTWADSVVYLNGGDRPAIGALGLNTSLNNLNGSIDELRITNGVGRYASNFAPPSSRFISPGLPAGYGRRTPITTAITIGQDISGSTVSALATVPGAINIYDGGRGRIVGTVKEKSTPTNTPLSRRVVLLSMPGSRAIRETWSDAETGAYVFSEIAMDRKYAAVSYDHTGIYRGVVADNLTPEAMS